MKDTAQCACEEIHSSPKKIVITGGPGAGKTTILGIAKKEFCKHVAVLPESATILYKGGFWRKETPVGIKAVQRSIFLVQKQQEWMASNEGNYAVILCDRGTLDGLAYWPESESSYFSDLRSTKSDELSNYFRVIHLHTPDVENGYNLENAARIETPEEARKLDHRIEEIWKDHPRRSMVPSSVDFFTKAKDVLQIIRSEIPSCCRV